MNQEATFSSYYLAPIEFYYLLTQYSKVQIDGFQNFVKQTYRSRTYIMGPNGVQQLSIPLLNVKKRKPFKDVKICYAEDWQKVHWKTIEAGYRRSPYFEYYEDHFQGFYEKQFSYLFDFNNLLQEQILELLKLPTNISQSNSYIEASEDLDDFRDTLSPKTKNNTLLFPEYLQVFNDRNPFAPNLSIIDLLFNEGPNSSTYLKSISK